jgi:hypothetical protein
MRTFLMSATVATGALIAAMSGAVAQDAPFCMQKGSAGPAHCVYQTITACEQAKEANPQSTAQDLCLIRSLVDASSIQNDRATTGQGGSGDRANPK